MKILLYGMILFLGMPFFTHTMFVSKDNCAISSDSVQSLCSTCVNCRCEDGISIDSKKAASMYHAFFYSPENCALGNWCNQEKHDSQPAVLRRTKKYRNLCALVSNL